MKYTRVSTVRAAGEVRRRRRKWKMNAKRKSFQFIFSLAVAKWGSNFSFLPNIVKAIMGTNETNIMTISRKGYEICSTSHIQPLLRHHQLIHFSPLSTPNDSTTRIMLLLCYMCIWASRGLRTYKEWVREQKKIFHMMMIVCIHGNIWMDVLLL